MRIGAAGKGWLILLYSAKMLGAGGEIFDPPLWQVHSRLRWSREASGLRLTHCAEHGRKCRRCCQPYRSSRAWSAPKPYSARSREYHPPIRPTGLPCCCRPSIVRVGSWQAQAHLAVGAVPHQKIRRQLVNRLHVRIVAGGAFNVTPTSRTAPVLSPVLPAPTSVAVRSMLSCSGFTRLKGCELWSWVPELSPGIQLPFVGIWPNSTVSADRDGAVVATQTQAAVAAQWHLLRFFIDRMWCCV